MEGRVVGSVPVGAAVLRIVLILRLLGRRGCVSRRGRSGNGD